MGWADRAIEELLAGYETVIHPRGNSMTPRVRSGDSVRLVPITTSSIKVGDVVLVRVRGTVYLHLVKGISQEGVLIGNNHGGINGWTSFANVYGRMTYASIGDKAPVRHRKAKARDYTDPSRHGAVAKGGPITRMKVSNTAR